MDYLQKMAAGVDVAPTMDTMSDMLFRNMSEGWKSVSARISDLVENMSEMFEDMSEAMENMSVSQSNAACIWMNVILVFGNLFVFVYLFLRSKRIKARLASIVREIEEVKQRSVQETSVESVDLKVRQALNTVRLVVSLLTTWKNVGTQENLAVDGPLMRTQEEEDRLAQLLRSYLD